MAVDRTGWVEHFRHALVRATGNTSPEVRVAELAASPEAIRDHVAHQRGVDAADVFVAGPIESRLLLVPGGSGRWSAHPLGIDLDLSARRYNGPPFLEQDLRGADPGAVVELNDRQLQLLGQPVVHLVALYHPEHFPLPRFPLGISDLARAARSTFMGRTVLTDMQLSVTVDELADRIAATAPDILGISATFGQHDVLTRLLTRLEDAGRVPPWLLFGGSLSARLEELLVDRYPQAIVSRNAGEQTMLDVMLAWHGQLSRGSIRGARMVDGGSLVITPRASNREYDDIIPELDLLGKVLRANGVLQLESSRGCTHACSFCPREHKGNWVGGSDEQLARIMPFAEAVFDEVTDATRRVFLVDEEFLGKDHGAPTVARGREIATSLWRRGFEWETSARVDQVHRPDRDGNWHAERIDLWRDMTASGLSRILFGVESGVESILKRFNKHTTPHQNVLAVRLLTTIGVPIRCTYITFDPLMSFDELIESYQFQGRTDLTLRRSTLEAPELFEAVQDAGWVEGADLGIPFYKHVSYMLVSMECLIGSPYLRAVEAAGLARDVLPQMGRRNADYLEPGIGHMSDWSQRWVDRNFSLDYTFKSIEKITVGDERAAVRSLRVDVKESAYVLLGRLLAIEMGDAALLARTDEDGAELLRVLGGRSLAPELGADDPVMRLVMDQQAGSLSRAVERTMAAVRPILRGPYLDSLLREVDEWQQRAEWTHINSPQQCATP